MKTPVRNWQAALLAWCLATLLVGGGFVAFQALRGRPISWQPAATGAALAGVYALYLAYRFRDRDGTD